MHKSRAKSEYVEVKCLFFPCSSDTHGTYFASDSDLQKHLELDHSHDPDGFRYDELDNGLYLRGTSSLLSSQDISKNQIESSNHKKHTFNSDTAREATQGKVTAAPMQSFSLSHYRPQTTEHEIILIESIKIGDMCNLLGHPGLPTVIEEMKTCHVNIFFTRSKGAIKLRGTLSHKALECAKARLGPLIPFSNSTERDPAPKPHPSINLDLRFKQKKEAANPVELLPIHPSEDREAVTTWQEFISPSLSEILQDADFDYPYNVTLVRQKQKDALVNPATVIRFQSFGQTTFQRDKLQRKIKDICLQNHRSYLPIHFYNATMATLGGDSPPDDPPDDMGIPHHARYYRRPGMSASIGMGGCNHVFATLGGYIWVDRLKYMLTVRHLIDDAAACRDCRNTSTIDNQVNSPAPIDVLALKRFFDKKIRRLEEQIRESWGDEATLEEMMNDDPENQREYRRWCGRWRKDLDKRNEDFRLGQLEQSSGGRTLHPPSVSRKNGRDVKQHYFDWAIFRVDDARLGKNRYRYPNLPEGQGLSFQHFEEEAQSSEGIGDLCESSREFTPGETVYYVGSKSGYREGKINELPIFCKDDEDREFQEWGIIPDVQGSYRLREDDVKGDSGAWIVAKSDNHILGLLSAQWGEYLLFTPINEVFQQISKRMGDVRVEIARSNTSPAPSSNVTTISGRLDCCSILYSEREPKQYTVLNNKVCLPPGTATVTKISKNIHSLSRSPSPVPSLISSDASLSDSRTSTLPSPSIDSLDSVPEAYNLDDPLGNLAVKVLPIRKQKDRGHKCESH
ncbi:MAG: hypothetical protein M1821_008737 [Bathelium mastoideum]|nr:MAG: hypothetical protein M1821_008737 [Bathelium mastoideum]